jgi:2,3-bisphosphoglycerate-independent phosphoglycerate mutase
MKRMLFIFIDGFGIGEKDLTKNPVLAARTPAFDRLLAEGLIISADASLGVPGLPQSATGQTAIFTGVNAPEIVGRHVNAQPTKPLRDIIEQDNLFKILLRKGLKVANANVYRQEYLDRMNDPADKRYKPSVTSVMTMSAGLQFRKVEEFSSGRGIYHDITGQIIVDSGYDSHTITPGEAAARYYAIARENDFTLFEHFVTDLVGHRMDMQLAVNTLELLDAFLFELLLLLDPEKDILFITSDHGNIEDISVKTHTRNPVPVVIYGKLPESFDVEIRSLLDIVPAVLAILNAE